MHLSISIQASYGPGELANTNIGITSDGGDVGSLSGALEACMAKWLGRWTVTWAAQVRTHRLGSRWSAAPPLPPFIPLNDLLFVNLFGLL